MQAEEVGEVYAQALVNEALKAGALEEITGDVRGIGELLKGNAAFGGFVKSLTVGDDERVVFVEKIFGGRVHPLTLSVLKSLSRRERFMFLGGVVSAFEKILHKMGECGCGAGGSGAELPAAVVGRVSDAVGKSVGKKADVKVSVDAELIGGMPLRSGDTLYAGSVASLLASFEAQLRRGGVSKLQGDLSGVLG